MRRAGRTFRMFVVACCLAAVLASTAHARSGAQYRIEGRGWGHGIGMSQYGALGYAERGWTSQQIIEHYFTGTVVAPRPDDGPTSLRVLLQSYLAPARIELTSAGIVNQGVTTRALQPGDIVEMRSTGAFLVTTIVRDGTRTILTGASSADATIVPEVDGGAKILFTSDFTSAGPGTTYHGTLTGHRFEGKVSVINTVPVEDYVRGVVPREVSASWPAEALKAQAIAARSYALTGFQGDYNWFDVYSDTRSQVYGGIPAEADASDAAVAATAGQVARVGSASGPMARTFFFSTSAGRTAANEQVWGSTPYSYLRSVPSPYERASSKFIWSGSDLKRYTPSQLAAVLGPFRSISQRNYGSGYVREVRVTRKGGQAASTYGGESFRSKLGLNSSWFRIQLLTIKAPTTAGAGYFRITGRAPRTGITTLVLTRPGYRKVIRLKPTGALGAFSVRTKISERTTAALMRNGVAGPRIRIDAAQPV